MSPRKKRGTYAFATAKTSGAGGEDRAPRIPQPFADPFAQGGGAGFQALGRAGVAAAAGEEREDFAVQDQQAVQADIGLV